VLSLLLDPIIELWLDLYTNFIFLKEMLLHKPTNDETYTPMWFAVGAKASLTAFPIKEKTLELGIDRGKFGLPLN
jgi:hypothetical protein